MKKTIAIGLAASLLAAPSPAAAPEIKSGGIRMIPIQTPKGTFKVWTKSVGRNPRLRVLLLHGGPAATHEYFEAFDSFLPQEGIEYIYYDQLGSAYSDQPDEPSLWQIPRFVDEVEQVRVALGLGKRDFVLLGHSWGGILAMEYALAHQEHLKGLVISNMMASIPAYNEYAKNVLMPAMDQAALRGVQRLEAEKKTDDPRYMELLKPLHYEKHILRRPSAEWPEPVERSFRHLNLKIYVPMQGPSELGASGLLEKWDRTKDLAKIAVPTLVIGAAHDTMDPKHMEWMAKRMPNARYLHLPEGSHMSMYDDQERYFAGLVRFLRDLDAAGTAAPAPGYDKLAMFVGTWTIEGRTDGYRETCEWFPGRVAVVCDTSWNRRDGTTGRGMSVLGYRPEDGAYTYHGIGDRGRNETMRAWFEGPVFRAEGEGKQDGKAVKSRVAITPDDRGLHFAAWTSTDGGPFAEDGSFRYVRVP